jgi:pSer/pThr/pTyr-binding forkhead associated (FHA) protein
LVLTHPEVSRRHTKLRLDDKGDVYLMDNGSRNGTFVNRVRIMVEQQLHDGDMIKIGDLKLCFLASSPYAEASLGVDAPGESHDGVESN